MKINHMHIEMSTVFEKCYDYPNNLNYIKNFI